ncbi:MAG: hypothetical protein V1789_06375 [PVC group bacterium]
MKTCPLLSILSLIALTAFAGSSDDSKYSDEAENTAKVLREKIPAEIKTLGDHAWAGEYYHGDGRGVNVSLLLAPKSGYLFEWHGCLGLYDRNYGAVSEANGRIRLDFTFENKREGFQGIAEEFIPIPWGPRRYLVPADDVVGFCNDVNGGSEPREYAHGSYLLRAGDEKKNVFGFPSVPQKFQAYLLKRPIAAGIVAVGLPTTRPSVCDWNFKDIPVTLNVGKDHGLLPGMELHVVKPDNIVESVRITKVEDEKSEGVMTQIGMEEECPAVGWRLSTRFRWKVEKNK